MSKENEELENDDVEEENTDEQDLVDAVGAAIDEATPDDVLKANKDTNETDEGAEQTAEEIAAAEKLVEDEAAEKLVADEAAEKAAEEYAALTDEEKVAVDKAREEYDALSDEEKVVADKKVADEKAAEEADAEKVDPINDPIPESTKAETATRIKSLIELTKEATGRADDATAQSNEIIEQINNTGADPDQYANTLGFLSMYNSADPATRKKALAVAEGVVRELRIELGEGTVDLLDNHDDLRAKVEAGTLEQSDAIEIATGREKKLLTDARIEDANVKTANDEQTQANIDAGKAQLVKLETELAASDTEYARLRPTFVAMLRPALRKALATEWGEVAQDIYAAVKLANPKPAPVVPVPVITPLRPGGGSGGGADKEGGPDTALAAVDQALSGM